MEDKIETITKILDQFSKEEIGNRLSQFANDFSSVYDFGTVKQPINGRSQDVTNISEHTDKG